MHCHALLTVGCARCCEPSFDGALIGNIDMMKAAADCSGVFFARFVIDVEDRDFEACISQCLSARSAKA